jgi:hypothetical protein
VRQVAPLVAVLLVSFSNLLPVRCRAQSAPAMAASGIQSPSSDANGASGSPTTAADANKPLPAKTSGPAANPAAIQPAPAAPSSHTFPSRIAVGVKVSLLGAGIEVATPVTYRTNLRFGFNAFSYGRGFSNDGISYNANLSFRSVETHFDWFPFAGSFHLSPGLMIYNGNQVTANASVGGGQQFTLNNVSYVSDAATPVTGTGKVDFNRVAPTFLLGWGNLLPRSHRHFSVPFEFGVVAAGSPKTTLNLNGFACDPTGINCLDVATNSTIQGNVTAQQNKLNTNLSFFRAYPVISLGFGYKF